MDTVLDDYTLHGSWIRRDRPDGIPVRQAAATTTVHADAGTDTLVFGPGIRVSDVAVAGVDAGNDLIVGVRDPAHPGAALDATDDHAAELDATRRTASRTSRFADGTTLNIGADARRLSGAVRRDAVGQQRGGEFRHRHGGRNGGGLRPRSRRGADLFADRRAPAAASRSTRRPA